MGKDAEKNPVILNLGCGFSKMKKPVINVDKFEICNPDVVHDLEQFPYPWEDNSVDMIYAFHVFEHLKMWWDAFVETARILKFGGFLDMRIPDESSSSAGTYRDHLNIISIYSFCGVSDMVAGRHNTNAWAAEVMESVPMRLVSWMIISKPEYAWLVKWFPKVFSFCANHLRNFAWETRFLFRKEICKQKENAIPQLVNVGEASRI